MKSGVTHNDCYLCDYKYVPKAHINVKSLRDFYNSRICSWCVSLAAKQLMCAVLTLAASQLMYHLHHPPVGGVLITSHYISCEAANAHSYVSHRPKGLWKVYGPKGRKADSTPIFGGGVNTTSIKGVRLTALPTWVWLISTPTLGGWCVKLNTHTLNLGCVNQFNAPKGLGMCDIHAPKGLGMC